MIITLIGITLLALGIIGIIVYNKCSFSYHTEEVIGFISTILLLVGTCWTVAVLVLFAINHTAVDKQIHMKQMEHDVIVAQIEYINSDYEDVSKAEVIQRVYEWNSEVYSAKYWSENPWTSWCWDKRVVDSLEYIELDLKEPDAK